MIEKQNKLLIIEDDPGLQGQLRWSFEGFEIEVADDRNTALAQLRRFEPCVVTLDLGLPPDPGGISEGFAILEAIIALAPDTKVIVVTGHDDRSNAVRAIGLGAYDFYEKPIDSDLLNLALERAARLYDLEQQNRRLKEQQASMPLEGLIAVSPEMAKVSRAIKKLAPTDVSTLLLGESGTGKEVLVKALHSLSCRAKKRLVAINCAAIPETLLESELFGYERGAFTGASKTTPGKIECADGGLLFLDEIGDLPLSLQAKLLRFLQERVIERIGGRTEIPVDVRVISATHQNLLALIKEGKFREDLYYRINEATIVVPPLRDRQDDAVVLARHFLNRFVEELKQPVREFSRGALEAIEQYNWPGNVRELENRVKRALVMADGIQITTDDLELAEPEMATEPFNLRVVREEAERKAVMRVLGYTDCNISRSAEMLGVTRPTLYNLVRKYNINT